MDKDRYAMFAPMHADDGTTLLTCKDCGCVVQERSREIHDQSHTDHLRAAPQRSQS
jgi:hypothetical protein